MKSSGFWDYYARKVVDLALGESIDFPELSDANDGQRFRSAVSCRRIVKNIKFSTRRLESGVLRVTRIGTYSTPGQVGELSPEAIAVDTRPWSRKRKNWNFYALKVAGLTLGESVVFADLLNDQNSVKRVRVALASNPASKLVNITVSSVPYGVKVTRFAGRGKDQDPQERPAPIAVVETAPVVMATPDGKCAERGCVFPAGASGYCRQHAFWSKQISSVIGSSLSGGNMDGV